MSIRNRFYNKLNEEIGTSRVDRINKALTTPPTPRGVSAPSSSRVDQINKALTTVPTAKSSAPTPAPTAQPKATAPVAAPKVVPQASKPAAPAAAPKEKGGYIPAPKPSANIDTSAAKKAKAAADSKLDMDKIQSDPTTALGYEKVKDPKTGILSVKQDPDPGHWGSYSPGTNTLAISPNASPERYKMTATHELGHAGSVATNPSIAKMDPNDPALGREELRQRRADLNKRTGKAREDSLAFTQDLNDRDQIALDKANDATRNKARQILYKKYGAPDRSTMSDKDLGKTATGSIIPEERAMSIRERFYANLNMIREDYDHVYKSVANQLQGYADKDKKNRNKNSTNQKWYKLWSSGAKRSRKKAVTGMDEEADQLDELRRPKNPDRGRKYISDGARAAEDAAAKKYYDKYDDETDARRKALRSKSDDDRQSAENANAVRQRAAKRVIKLQKIK